MNRKTKIVFALGVLLILLPFTGFPESWKSFFDVIFGLALGFVGYSMHKEAMLTVVGKPSAVSSPKPFVENRSAGE